MNSRTRNGDKTKTFCRFIAYFIDMMNFVSYVL